MIDRVAFIGLGIMGEPMATHLLRAGVALTVHSRTKSRAERLIKSGATWANTAADAARDAEVIFICVPDTPDVQQIAAGMLDAIKPGAIVIDHSTISPTFTREFSKQFAARSASWIDAPVSGGDVGARNATLSIMCGGNRESFDRVVPLLNHLGKTITYCGPSGAGQLTKLVNQVLVLGTLMAVSEGIALARSGGLDIETTLRAVGGGAARSWQLEQLGPKIAAGDFAPGFMIDLARKDLRLVSEFCAQSGLNLPGKDLVEKLYRKASELGCGRDGTQAIYKALESLNRDRE